MLTAPIWRQSHAVKAELEVKGLARGGADSGAARKELVIRYFQKGYFESLASWSYSKPISSADAASVWLSDLIPGSIYEAGLVVREVESKKVTEESPSITFRTLTKEQHEARQATINQFAVHLQKEEYTEILQDMTKRGQAYSKKIAHMDTKLYEYARKLQTIREKVCSSGEGESKVNLGESMEAMGAILSQIEKMQSSSQERIREVELNNAAIIEDCMAKISLHKSKVRAEIAQKDDAIRALQARVRELERENRTLMERRT